MELTWYPAPAKLNLFLHVIGRRDDGYHLLQSVFVLIDWADTLHFERRADGRIVRHDLGTRLPEDDLCLRAARALHAAGIDNRRIVYLPMRGSDTPSPRELQSVAGGPFQSMTCLGGCAASPRFCSIAWDRSVAWCSYTTSRRKLEEMSYRGLIAALTDLPLVFCGNESTSNSHRLEAIA